jgi:hypothetical protein
VNVICGAMCFRAVGMALRSRRLPEAFSVMPVLQWEKMVMESLVTSKASCRLMHAEHSDSLLAALSTW